MKETSLSATKFSDMESFSVCLCFSQFLLPSPLPESPVVTDLHSLTQSFIHQSAGLRAGEAQMKGSRGWAQSSEREEQLCEHTVDRRYLGDAETSRRAGGRDGQEAELYVVGLGDPLKYFRKGITWADCVLACSFSLSETEPAGLRRPIRSFATVCVRPGGGSPGEEGALALSWL